MRSRTSVLISLAVVLSSFAVGTPASVAGPSESFYVSLGDSLAVGFQPGPGETREGYVDNLWRGVRETEPDLAKRKFGCAGETSESLLSGDGSPCTYAAGSQLDATVAFLGDHPGQVPFITINIGANDVVDQCFDFSALEFDRTCVTDLLPELADRVTQTVDALRAAAGSDVPILGMTYYNPFLGLWVVPRGHPLARNAQRAWKVFNAELTGAYENAGAIVVDVAGTFKIDSFDDTAMLHGTPVPLNVALACRWTWFCSDEAFGDPHANTIGYRKIARAFERVLAPLLA